MIHLRKVSLLSFFGSIDHSCAPDASRRSKSRYTILFVVYPTNEGERALQVLNRRNSNRKLCTLRLLRYGQLRRFTVSLLMRNHSKISFPGQTHIPGLARVPALPRVPGLARGTFPDAPSPFTPYLREPDPYRRNKHHVGNNVTANSVSGACTNPNNTDPTASPASSTHLGTTGGSSAHQDCYKHSPQHGGESCSFCRRFRIRGCSFTDPARSIPANRTTKFPGTSNAVWLGLDPLIAGTLLSVRGKEIERKTMHKFHIPVFPI